MSLTLSMRSGSLRSASLIFLITGSVRSLQIPSTWASPTTTTMLEWVSDALLICSAMWTFLSSMSFLTRVGYFLRIASTYLSSSSAKLSWTASTLRLPPMESDMPERRYLILSEADISSHLHCICVDRYYLRTGKSAGVHSGKELPSDLCPVFLGHPLLVLGGLFVDGGHLRLRTLALRIVLGLHERVVATHVQLYQDGVGPGVLHDERHGLCQIEDVSRADDRYHDPANVVTVIRMSGTSSAHPSGIDHRASVRT